MQRLGFAAVMAAIAIAVTGCGKSANSASGSAAGAKVPAFAAHFTPPASGCGSFKDPLPADPDGAIAALDAAHQAALRGYADFPGSTIQVLKSAWANWHPAHPKPFTVAISWGQLVSDFQIQMIGDLKKDLQSTPGVGNVIVRTTGSNLDIAQQLQQYQSLVQNKPDLIILETPSADSFDGPVKQAATQGIPTVTVLSPVPVNGAVNVDGNNYLSSATGASYLARLLNGKGSVLLVRALAVAAVDLQVATAWQKALADCPGIKIAGQVFGAFSEAQAKSQVLQFLSTHPQSIAGMGILAGEADGVVQAFQQVGRPVPLGAEVGMDRGFLGYWQTHQSDYHASSTSLPPVPAARAVAEIVGRMLAGQGVKLNTLVAEEPLVNDANLSQWADPSWTLSTPGTVSGAPDSFMPSSFINDFFNHPAPLK